jgi:hypothetical protein
MLFQCPPYWGGFFLSLWAILTQYLDETKQRIKQRTVAINKEQPRRMSVKGCEQLGPDMVKKATIIVAVKNRTVSSQKHQEQRLFLFEYEKDAKYVK